MKKIIVFICTILPLLAIAQNTDKEKFDLAKSYYNAKEYEKAYPLYLELANNGNAKAQCVMGHYYFYGYSPVKENYAKAYEWYKKAAEQGDGSALNSIGYMYSYGYYLIQNKAKAFEYYMQAARQGEPLSTYNIGVMYENGEYVLQNNIKAYQYYSLAGLAGYVSGSVSAGCMLWNDREVKEISIDKSKSYTSVPNYFDGASVTVSEKSFNENNSNGQTDYINADEAYMQPILDSNGHLNLNVNPVSPTEEWFLLAAKQDSAYGIYWLTRYLDFNQWDLNYMHFRGMYYDSILSEWDNNIDALYEIAAQNGNADAQAVVGYNYIIKRNYDKAMKWLLEASKKGAERIFRAAFINMPLDVAIAICKYLKENKEYSLIFACASGGCETRVYPQDEDYSVRPENGIFYIIIANRQNKQGIVMLDMDGHTVAKTPLSYEDLEWKVSYDKVTKNFTLGDETIIKFY